MNYLVLTLTAFTLASQNIFKQRFNKLKMGGSIFFAAMICFFAAVFFSGIATVQGDWQYSLSLLPYSAGFSISYACSTLFMVLAIINGSLAATALVVNCSLLLPSFFCIIFFDEPVTATLVIGTVLLIAAIFLVNYPSKDQPQKITLKWAIFAALAFLGNGSCSIVQKLENRNMGAEGSRVFMIVALLVASLILLLVHLSSKERVCTTDVIKRGSLYALGAGFANGFTNFFVMYLNLHKMNGSIMFPVISGGSMFIIFLWSVLVLKERFTIRQYIGYALGLAAIVVLNI